MSRRRIGVEGMGVVEVPCLRDEHVRSGKLLRLTWLRDWIGIGYTSECLLG